jgi:hypothetical protein
MPADANAAIQALVTKTATFNGTAFDTVTGTPRRGYWVRVLYKNATNASGSNAVTFSVDESADNSTWFAKTNDAADVVNLSTTAQAGEIFIPIETSKRYIRLTATFSGAGSTPTIDYQGDLVLARP